MMGLANWVFGNKPSNSGDIWAALDVGSSNIVCLIARAGADGNPRIVGMGYHAAEGLRGGLVTDIEAAQESIVAAVEQAENNAHETIERVTVSLPGTVLSSQNQMMETALEGREVTASHIDRILAEAQMMINEEVSGSTLSLIHTLPVHYILDGQKGIRDPLGMVGDKLQTQIHLVSAIFGPLRTLENTIKHCRLDVEQFVAAPYASGLSCLVKDEMDLGCTLIDMGATTTSFSIFNEGHMIYAGGIRAGGDHITSDIARCLTTPLAQAERMKNLYGSAVLGPRDEQDILDVPQVGEEGAGQAMSVPKAHLIRIIQPRLEEILDLVRSKLISSGLQAESGKRVVLTGGASQLQGVRDMAQRVLDKQVRLGRPLRIIRPNSELPQQHVPLEETYKMPSFATATGLLAHAIEPDLFSQAGHYDYARTGFWNRFGGMFR